jgi:hypothetical protein
MVTQYATVEASGAEGQANLNLWLKDASVYVPGIHRSVLKRQLILACREFFEQSRAWRASIGPLNVVAGQNTYMLSPFNSTTDVVGVIAVAINAVPVMPIAFRPPNDGTQTPPVPTNNQPFGYYMLRPDVMALYPTPAKSLPGSLQVLCSLKPKASVKQVPHIAVSDFYEAILCGVVYRCLNQPGKPYSNPALAAQFESKFRTYIGMYAGLAKTGFNQAPSWRFAPFGHVNRVGRGW